MRPVAVSYVRRAVEASLRTEIGNKMSDLRTSLTTGYGLWEETHVTKVEGSNPSAVYWMDIISHIML